jgi:hypothetical protein
MNPAIDRFQLAAALESVREDVYRLVDVTAPALLPHFTAAALSLTGAIRALQNPLVELRPALESAAAVLSKVLTEQLDPLARSNVESTLTLLDRAGEQKGIPGTRRTHLRLVDPL